MSSKDVPDPLLSAAELEKKSDSVHSAILAEAVQVAAGRKTSQRR